MVAPVRKLERLRNCIVAAAVVAEEVEVEDGFVRFLSVDACEK